MEVKNNSFARVEIPETYITQEGQEETSLQTVEVELLPPVDINDARKLEIYKGIADIDERLEFISSRVDELNSEIDSLTNHADGIDYAVAVASGVLTGLIDSFFVGEWDFKDAKAKANEKVNKQVTDYAKKQGYEGKKDKDGNTKYPLKDAISFLEEKFGVDQDNAWKGKDINVSATSHHLDDLAHHPTPLGLVSAIVVQFLRVGIFTNRNGKWHFEKIDTDPKERIKTWTPILLFGLTTWIVNIIEKKSYEVDDTKIPGAILNLIKAISAVPMMITILKTANNWYGHLMSDKAGSKNTPGGGMGIPGLLMSLMKELSMIPGLVFPAIPQNLAKLYEKGIGAGKGQVDLGIFNCLFEGASSKFDTRTEEALGNLLGKQAIPVIIDEVLVRGFYFMRHFTEELKHTSDISEINWNQIKPFGNRTVERMMTIASGTFTAVDVADAAIRSGGFNASCILRLNFVGIGRFAVAIGTDIGMGIKKRKKKQERSEALSEYISLANIKIYYRKAALLCSEAELHEREANMHTAEKEIWQELQYTTEAMAQLYETIGQTCQFYMQAISQMDECADKIVEALPGFEQKNPGMREKMLGRLK